MVTAVVVGIDVGGEKKGFHAVAFQDRIFGKASSTDPCAMVKWCLDWNASVVAVDAPCGWSQSGSSRLAERELSGRGIHSFATPTCLNAQAHQKGFYGWVFNGLRLYTELGRHHYRLFDGGVREGPICFETFPHAVVCALLGRVVPAKPKKERRLGVLAGIECDRDLLSNIDFIDAALCAVTAENFRRGRTEGLGSSGEGIIVVPKGQLGLTVGVS